MSSEPPHKRKRTTNEDLDSETSEPAIIRSRYWFDDGNIIIQVENTQFRVHRSMLSRHSTVFKDMFDIPQPPQTDEISGVEGCPLVHLSDKPSDVEYIMSIFYDNIRVHDMRIPMSFNHCGAFLRLGKKYDIEHLYNEGLKRFRHEFPTTLEKWHPLQDVDGGTPGNELYPLSIGETFYEAGMALAHEFSINRALPAICLSLVQEYDTGQILQKIASLKDNPQVLDYSHLLMKCLEGRDQLLRRTHRIYQEWASSESSSPIPDKKCISTKGCTSSRASALMLIFGSDDETFSSFLIIDPYVAPPQIDDLLCNKCQMSLRAAIEKFRADLWTDLPSLFKIGESWDTLTDF